MSPSAWRYDYLCLEMKFNQGLDTMVKCQSAIAVPPREAVDFHIWSLKVGEDESLLVSDDEVSLPGGLVVTPTFVSGNQSGPITVTLNNVSDKPVLIPPGTVVCHAEAVHLMTQVSDPSSQSQKDLFELIDLEQTRKNCRNDQIEEVRRLLLAHKDAFSLHDFDIGKAKTTYHEINLTDHRPFKEKYRRIPPSMLHEVREHIAKMLDSGVIKPSQSPYASAVVLVRKKSGGLRFCVDFRRLNGLTVRDSYGLPRADDMFDRLAGAAWFSTLDLKSGYWQIQLAPEHKHLTAFTVGPLGFYEFDRMPFGLTNAGSTFQRMIEGCMGNDYLEMCLLYLDDIIVFSRTFEEHVERVDKVLKRLRECGLKVNPGKCSFFLNKAKFLGHVVSADGLQVDPEKITAVVDWKVPTDRQNLRRFLGFAGYYRRFIRNFSSISAPLHDLLKGEVLFKKKTGKSAPGVPPFRWTEEHQQCFEGLKEALTSTPVLAFADFGKPFEVHVDASLNGLGAILYQADTHGKLHPVAFGSRGLKPPEQNYPAHKLEFCALKWAVTEKFKDYLYHSKFRVVTDNNPLTYILTSAKLDATGHRWVAELANYDFDIVYRAARNNVAADGLSRSHDRREFGKLEKTLVSALFHGTKYQDEVCLVSCQASDAEVMSSQVMEQVDWLKEQQEDNTVWPRNN